MLYSFKSFFPLSDLLLDCLPFSEFDFAKHVTLNDDFFAQLVNLSINNLVLNSVNRPLFNLINVNLANNQSHEKDDEFSKEESKSNKEKH